MSFIVPILVFEILTGKTLGQHSEILKRSGRKTIIITLLLILLSSFIANGNGFDPVLAIMSVAGSLLIITVLYRLSKGTEIAQLVPGKRGFRVLCVYLLLLYIVTFIFLLPERIPTTIAPYLSIIFFYAIAIALLSRSGKENVQIIQLDTKDYSPRNFIMFIPILILAVTIACFVPNISTNVLMLTYFSLIITGTAMFLMVARNILKQTY
ncbi:MAG: hypothetical protein K8R13_03500 [Methanococcoides sp.]|nr:hypothetical protein [Methanococcoides sp.]